MSTGSGGVGNRTRNLHRPRRLQGTRFAFLRDVGQRFFIGFHCQNGFRSSVEFLSCDFCPSHAAAWPASVLWPVRVSGFSGGGGRIVHSCPRCWDTPCMFAISVPPWAKLGPKAPTTLFVSSSYSLQMVLPPFLRSRDDNAPNAEDFFRLRVAFLSPLFSAKSGRHLLQFSCQMAQPFEATQVKLFSSGCRGSLLC